MIYDMIVSAGAKRAGQQERQSLALFEVLQTAARHHISVRGTRDAHDSKFSKCFGRWFIETIEKKRGDHSTPLTVRSALSSAKILDATSHEMAESADKAAQVLTHCRPSRKT